jgi:hypothetical protein
MSLPRALYDSMWAHGLRDFPLVCEKPHRVVRDALISALHTMILKEQRPLTVRMYQTEECDARIVFNDNEQCEVAAVNAINTNAWELENGSLTPSGAHALHPALCDSVAASLRLISSLSEIPAGSSFSLVRTDTGSRVSPALCARQQQLNRVRETLRAQVVNEPLRTLWLPQRRRLTAIALTLTSLQKRFSSLNAAAVPVLIMQACVCVDPALVREKIPWWTWDALRMRTGAITGVFVSDESAGVAHLAGGTATMNASPLNALSLVFVIYATCLWVLDEACVSAEKVDGLLQQFMDYVIEFSHRVSPPVRGFLLAEDDPLTKLRAYSATPVRTTRRTCCWPVASAPGTRSWRWPRTPRIRADSRWPTPRSSSGSAAATRHILGWNSCSCC